MKPRHLPLRLAALLLGICLTSARAEDAPKPAAPPAAKPAVAKPIAPPTKPPSEAELRATITKGLGFLAKEGEAWMTTKDCNGCHHMPEMLWSFREAKLRGFDVDQAKFDEWLAWAEDHSKDKKPGTEMMALMKLALPDRPMPELTKLILAEQKPDGSWKPAGQFSGMQKRGAPDAQANSTRVFLLALATPQAASADAQSAQAEAATLSGTARAKAAAVLAKKDAPTSTESLVFRTLDARSLGKPADTDALRAQIISQQRGDGGWSSIIGENMSDPLATGQVLYALQPSAVDPKTAEAIARAQLWLVKTQREDGSWPIDYTHISKLDRSAPAKAKSVKDVTMIYTYFGAGWATIGLLQAVPLKSESAK
ncbi:MAG: hypothetical protein ABI318_13590 [Chthoniobacteraceae bacterium]